MNLKNSLFDRVFFFIFSGALSLFLYLFTTYFSFVVITNVIGGTFTFGEVCIIGTISFLLGVAAFYFTFRFCLLNLFDKSLSGLFKEAIKRQKSLRKDNLTLKRSEDTTSGTSSVRDIQKQYSCRKMNRQHKTTNK